MPQHRGTTLTTLTTLALLATLAITASTAHAQFTAYALTATPQGTQQLVRLNTSAPNAVTTVGPTGVTLIGIDFRPATNQLCGYDGDKLYTIDLTTGAASAVFDVANTAGNVGFDFNPTVDRIRVIGVSGSNFRLNPFDGSAIVDGAYSFAMGDVNVGRVPAFTAVAYTNSDTDPTTGTTLFAIDPTLGQLIQIASPNGGAVNTVGNLGIANLGTVTSFDIVTVGGVNTAFFTAMLTGSVTSQLYTLNLGTGAATLVGSIGAAGGIQGFALTPVPEPGTWALLLTGLAGLGITARRRRTVRS